MKKYAPGVDASEIRLVSAEERAGEAKEPAGEATPAGAMGAVPASAADSADRYLKKATKEYASGRVDKALWKRAMAKAGDDEVLAQRIYLQNRAIALRVARRNEKAARYASVAEALGDGPNTGIAEAVPKDAAKVTPKVRSSTRLGGKRTLLIAGALGTLVVVGLLVAVLSGGDESGQTGDAGPATGRIGVANVKATVAAALAASESGKIAADATVPVDFVGKVRELEKEGNWNLVVLYGVEWTRKQPTNPDAWQELSQGYLKLRQYGEALDAANKATVLAPEDFRSWQNLGQVYVGLERPADALSAFHRATTLNDRDVVSLVQEGKLHANAGRLADARVVYGKALAASADDAQALCGAASVAHKEGRGKDGEAMMQRLTSRGELCVDPTAGATVRAEPSATVTRKRLTPQ